MSDLIGLYAYAVPTNEALRILIELGPILELGAGAGYWARLLRDLGGDIVASDSAGPEENSWIDGAPTWTEVAVSDATLLQSHDNRAVFVSWPERPGGFLPHFLDQHQPGVVAMITDGRHPIPNPDPLFDRLEAKWRVRRTLPLPYWPNRQGVLTIWQQR